ncbi:hypothetical protein B484DRAFT_411043 [Ochromonadaceae sp. CCMP2298]|nr:hypothetical protein B484DRAFT_411043 [Ochromonadaceae sp. CCMP2298]
MSSPVKVGTLTYLVAVVGVIILARLAERMRFISKDSFQIIRVITAISGVATWILW